MATKVILRADITGVGKRGDIVDVSDGYARNFLYPRGKAMAAAAGTVAQAQAMRRSRDLRDAKDRAAAETIARALVAKHIVVSAKAHGDKLFGSVAAPQVAAAVKAQTTVELDPRTIQLQDHIKTLGEHQVTVKLHHDVQFAITVEVQRA
jgi:large subunit ribosomal protein L9